MPFTPLHLGPALSFGLPFRKYLHVPTFILANLIVDVEPFPVLFYRLGYPLHGYFHTFFSAFFTGLIVGFAMFFLERFLYPLFKVFLLVPSDNRLNMKSFMFTGALGTVLHVLLDSPLYGDIRPFFPLAINLLHNPDLTLDVYNVCAWLGIFGVMYYIGLLVFSVYRKLST